ncbi:MAG: tryptophan synthase subunit alpha [Alphaproteobacteria bacterium]|nr:tryptophan synthase subunit alpha [Alphaproteobacteria bacterium]
MLEDRIRAARKRKRLLLMPHLVLGYPSFESNRELIRTMVESGADIIEMQIPFSDPMADGPVILKANDAAVRNGVTTSQCLAFAKEICALYPETIFLFMTYANVPFVYGLENFVKVAADAGILGLIIPDLPPEEGAEYLSACERNDVAPIFLFTPTNTPERLRVLASYCRGLVYCVGRTGVTGIKTKIDDALGAMIQRYKSMTTLPIGLGFGLQSKKDIDALPKDVDIAIIGTKILTLHNEGGAKAVGQFLRELAA